ncbi:hypothetical protein [Carnobacterium sp. TMP28]|uniref:hypothetical protein n=1 Tax=Carnobacterium sp. TMP28 TaxID=3397060 RepID=UPI0039E17F0B
MKKLVFAATLSIIGLTLMGCGQTADNETDSSSQATSSSKQQEETEQVEYKGMVKEDGLKEEQQIILSSLKQTKESDEPVYFDEVILSAEGVPILDEKTQKEILIEDITAGSTITVFLVPEPITTMSIPPQIPGNSIVKILVSE